MSVDDFVQEMRALSDSELIQKIDEFGADVDIARANMYSSRDMADGGDDSLLEEMKKKFDIADDKHQLAQDVLIGRGYTWGFDNQWKKRDPINW